MRSAKDRFEAKIERIPESGCWIWMGSTAGDGYGQIWMHGKYHLAHRAAYEMFVGPIRNGLQVDHLCRVRYCCNPHHLEPVTARENTLRSDGVTAKNAEKTHCSKGHPFDEKNTYIHRGGRYCRKCCLEHSQKHKAKKRALKIKKPVFGD